MKRTRPPARKAPMRRTPMKPHRKREEPGKKAAVENWRITLLGAVNSPLHGHHCVPKQTLKRIAKSRGLTGAAYWALVYDPLIGIPLDHQRHWNHEYGGPQHRIPGEEIPPRVWERAIAIGPEAVAALEREHPFSAKGEVS